MSSLRQFFASVLPISGLFVTAHRHEGRMRQRAYNSVDAVVDFCELYSMSNTDCWFAVASYKQGWHEVTTAVGTKKVLRTKENALCAKALWLDIDVGDGKDYATRDEAVQELANFAREVGLGRPWVVASGKAGLHLYWAFTEEVSKEQWQELANRLHQATKELDFKADPARTRDITSLLRCPLTWNMKGTDEGGQPHQVQILVEGREQPYEFYAKALGRFEPKVDNPTHTTLHYEVPAIDLSGVEGLSELNHADIMNRYFHPIKEDYPVKDVLDVIAGCEQIRTMDSAKEPAWRAALSVLQYCDKGVAAAHILSKSEKWRTEYNIDEKLHWLNLNGIKPMTCKTFNEVRSGICNRCPHNGLINSPISVPPRRIPVTQVEATPAPTTQVQDEVSDPEGGVAITVTSEVKTSDPMEIKTKNSTVNSSGCYVRVKNSEGDFYWKQIYEYPVYPIQRIKDRNNNGEMQVSYIFRKHNAVGYDDFQITGDTIMGTGLNGFLGSVGFLLHEKDRKNMAGLLIDILKHTEHTLEETKIANRLGWSDDFKSFLLGNKLYKTDGVVVEVSPKGNASEYSNQTVARGTLEQWKAIANVYNKDGLEWGQAAVASAFASPLMPIGALEKAALLFLTGDKGVGKSTALSLAVSVFGNPARLMINKDDTYLARLAKLGIMNNISAAFDEMTDLTPKEASELAYQITQGRGKDRMQQSGEGIQHNTTYWSCLPIMSANDSIIAALSQHGVDPTAQMSRVLEIKVTDINTVYDRAEFERCERLVRTLPHNYGTAGDVYMRYVTTHVEQIQDLIYQIEKRFIKHTNLNSNYRFWSYMCTRMIVGVMIAKQLGLVDYDVAKFFVYLVNLVNRSRADIDQYKWSPETAFPQFLAQHVNNRLVVTAPRRPKNMNDDETKGHLNDIGYVVQTPSAGRDIVIRYELSKSRCIISIHAIKEWCKRAGISYNDFIGHIGREYTVHSTSTRHELGRYTVYRNGTSIPCITVEIPKDMIVDEDVFDDDE